VILPLKYPSSFRKRLMFANEGHCERPSLRGCDLFIVGEDLAWVYAKNIRNNANRAVRFIARHPAIKLGA
jgi:hypothetical protein